MMSRKLACLALILPLGFVPGAANASFYTGAQLYESCTAQRGSNSYVEKTYECIAYITGAVDAFNTAHKSKSCIPAGVTISQLREATVGYLHDNPKVHSESGSDVVFAATRSAWPCAGAATKPAGKTGKTRKK
ncbi:Rap1a/Tai family immunity protein [Novosphingobium aerophilum]|uniref:Rap1a/Tai family immunity protein n=1 Tax=Novosphingobium TaxID=165696 RepID=UPI002D79838E|nr:Rap1a/Tai family immunity protein [Novosphingobium sp. RL4]WRT91664.1 Rap1a/Tai family immunity protein [Novosphingobium sp. RL4]